MPEPVTYVLEDKVAVLSMDDGKANALSVAMIDGIMTALARAESEASAVVLVGRPERFCAGFDLRVMMSGPAAAMDLLGHGSKLLLKLFGLPLPLVIACSGSAIAGGALVVLTGDYRIGAAGEFKIGLNEVGIGLPVPLLAMEFARARLLPTELAHATLAAKIYKPAEAVSAGYLDAVVPADELLARAKAEAARLGALSKSAYAATKKRLRGQAIEYITANMDADVRSLLSPS